MTRFLFALAVLGCTGAVADAGCPRRPLFPRVHAFLHGQPSPPPFAPIPATIPQAMPAFAPQAAPLMLFGSPVFPVMERPLPAAIRGLTLLPGSSGGCGPNGCPKLPAGMPR